MLKGYVRVVRRLAAVFAIALVTSAACNDRAPEETNERDVRGSGSSEFSNFETVVRGLEVPWGLAFVDEDTILVTERAGRVRVIDHGRLRDEPAADLDVVAESEAGLLGIALHPKFPDERTAYVYYTARDGNRVSSLTVTDGLALRDEKVIVDGIPGGPNHDGGALAFGPDELLYIGTGDAGDGSRAADRRSLAGKILRVRPDGSTPDDNPFDGSPVYSYGHRNVQGLDFDADGRLYASEHGPTGESGLCCHDEINRVEAGRFYGWPFRAGRAGARSDDPPVQTVDPVAESGDETWAPAGIVVDASGDRPSILLANLGGAALLRFAIEGSDDLGAPEVVLRDEGRLRAAAIGPDDCLYVTTSNRDGRGSPREGDDRILRACPSS